MLIQSLKIERLPVFLEKKMQILKKKMAVKILLLW